MIVVDKKGVTLSPAPDVADDVVRLYLFGRLLWVTRLSRGRTDEQGWHLDWPELLVPRLAGVAEFECVVGPEGDELLHASTRVSFGGTEDHFDLRDPASGRLLIINKWNRLAESFVDTDATFIEKVIESTEELSGLLRAQMGIESFVTGGTLLGPVRDGRVMPGDDDTDLAYLSEFQNPSDIVLQSFKIERFLRSKGYEIVRHSSGHLQILFPGHAMVDDYHIDLFTYFVVNGWFYGTFHARERADRVTIEPLRTIDVQGHQLPAPHDVEAMLAAIYGPTWRTPDPSFRFETPPPAQLRYYWWLNHFDANRENWEDFWRANQTLAGDRTDVSAFAEWAADKLTPGGSVYEMGCGDGSTLCRLTARRPGLGTDYARPALILARRNAERLGCRASFDVSNQYSTRDTSHALGQAASLPGPIDVVVENLFDVMHFLGWDVTMRVMRRLLDRGGRALVGAGGGCDGNPVAPDEPVADRFFTPEEFELRIDRFGMRVETKEHLGEDMGQLAYVIGKETA